MLLGRCIRCGSMCGVGMIVSFELCLNVFMFFSCMMKLRFLFISSGNGWVGFRLIGVISGVILWWK